MATLECLPLADCEPCDVTGGVVFIQRISHQYLRRLVLKNFGVFIFFLFVSTYPILVHMGYLPMPAISSGKRLLGFSTWITPLAAFATAINIAVFIMCKNYQREVRIAHDGSLHINDELVRDATLIRSKVILHDCSYLPPLKRPTEAICLKANGKIVIIATCDVRSDLDELSQKLGVGLEIGEDIIEVKGVV